MNRRNFLALASGLLVPESEPLRRYFFAPPRGWRHQRLEYVFEREATALREATMTIDGVRLVPGAKLLRANQSNPAWNGVYTVSMGSWSRPTENKC